MTDATAYYLWTIVDNVWILSSTSCYTSLMKWNVNAAALISETTKQESQTPFIVVLLTFFWEFLEYLFFKIRFHCWGPFIVKLHTETLLKKSSSQVFSNDFFDIFQSKKENSAQGLLSRCFPINFEKKKVWPRLLTPLPDCLWNNVKERNLSFIINDVSNILVRFWLCFIH